MSTKAALLAVLDGLSEEQIAEVLDFARFVAWQRERQDWRRFGQAQFARAYGPDEPEYTAADIKPAPHTP